jgi:UDP-GlcNAc:undecaprenyl-phosphate GlcNAc-1-phosphate transferase
MGDIGAMLLGLMLAYGPISSTASLDPALLTNYATDHALDRFPTFLPLLVPAAIFVIPYADLMFAIIRRTRAGQPLMAADREHLHHRVLNIGHSYRQSVLIMYLWAALFSVTVVSLSVVRTRLVVFVVATAVAVLTLLPVTMPSLRPWRMLRRGPAIPAVARAGAAAAAARPGAVSAAHRRTARTIRRGSAPPAHRGTVPAAHPGGTGSAAPRPAGPVLDATPRPAGPVLDAAPRLTGPVLDGAPRPAGPVLDGASLPGGSPFPVAGPFPADASYPANVSYPARASFLTDASFPADASLPDAGPYPGVSPAPAAGQGESPDPLAQPQHRDARPW